MTVPAVHARLEAVQARLAQRTEDPLEGQQAIDLPGHEQQDDEELPATPESARS